MNLSAENLRALRDCCRDDAAFEQMRRLLAAESGNGKPPLAVIDAERLPAEPLPNTLLQAVVEANQLLLTSTNLPDALTGAIAILGTRASVHRVCVAAFPPHVTPEQCAASLHGEWLHPAVAPLPLTSSHIPFASPGLSQLYEGLKSGKVACEATTELSAEELVLLLPLRPRCYLMAPILLNTTLWGFLLIEDTQCDRQWLMDDRLALQLMASSIASAIARQQASDTVHHNTTWLKAMTANVPGMIYQFLVRQDGQRQVLFASLGCRELLEVEPQDLIGRSSMIWEICHPNK